MSGRLPSVPDISRLQSNFQKVMLYKRMLKKRMDDLSSEISFLENEDQILTLVSKALVKLINDHVDESVSHLESFLSEGLKTIFEGRDIRVSPEVEIKRKKVYLSLKTIERELGGQVTKGDVRDSFGRSVMTVESLLLRILIVVKRGLMPALFLDESLHTLKPEYAKRMAEFLNTFCEKSGMDILMVSHNPALYQSGNHLYVVSRAKDGAKYEKRK